MRNVTIAAIQMSCSGTRAENIEKAVSMVRKAAQMGGQVILLPELFETWYFCQEKDYGHYDLARPLLEDPGAPGKEDDET